MKRSEINALILEAEAFFKRHHFKLPQWSTWSIETFKKNAGSAREIFANGLGWDLTDFGSGDFSKIGLLLFTVRNGKKGVDRKTYAEKVMIVQPHQVTPTHFHWQKMEDIINRGGGELVLCLHRASPKEGLSKEAFEVQIDGLTHHLQAGDEVRLVPGQSITLTQGLYHRFWAEGETTLVGEVSMVNDDSTDNRFLEEIGRFPSIVEDEPPARLLGTDYAKYVL